MKLVCLVVGLMGCIHLAHMEPQARDLAEQARTEVVLEIGCYDDDPENPFPLGQDRVAHGVMISERHIITAAHAVACPFLPEIRAKLTSGKIVRLIVDDEDDTNDTARLEIQSADNFGEKIVPPRLGICGDRLIDRQTHDGDSGRGEYDSSGMLRGIIVARKGVRSLIACARASWLRGT